MSTLFPSKAYKQASKLKLYRWQIHGCLRPTLYRLEPGVNYFVAMLEQLGCYTEWSCEGHPKGFYIVFVASYELALSIKGCGFFSVEIEGECRWSLRRHGADNLRQTEEQKTQALEWAAKAWEKSLGPLKPSKVLKWPRGCNLKQREEAGESYDREHKA